MPQDREWFIRNQTPRESNPAPIEMADLKLCQDFAQKCLDRGRSALAFCIRDTHGVVIGECPPFAHDAGGVSLMAVMPALEWLARFAVMLDQEPLGTVDGKPITADVLIPEIFTHRVTVLRAERERGTPS